MTPMESAQVRFGPADGAAGEDRAVWPGAAGRTRRSGAIGATDGAMTGVDKSPGRASPGWPSSGRSGAGAAPLALDLCDVRLEEVVRLRVAIASGQYRVSAADLADKLIAAFASSAESERKN